MISDEVVFVVGLNGWLNFNANLIVLVLLYSLYNILNFVFFDFFSDKNKI